MTSWGRMALSMSALNSIVCPPTSRLILIRRLDDPDSAAVCRVDVELWAEAIHDSALMELVQTSQRHWVGRLAEVVAGAQKAGDLPGS